MEDSTLGVRSIEEASADLYSYALDREELKMLLAALPEDSEVNRSKLEYELQILKIIGVGWSISYFTQETTHKDALAMTYWNSVHELSVSVSSSAGLMVGKEIDYFQEIRDRLDRYVKAMDGNPKATEPAVVVGPEFARICGHPDDVYTVMVGSKMFIAALAVVKEYLRTVTIEGPMLS